MILLMILLGFVLYLCVGFAVFMWYVIIEKKNGFVYSTRELESEIGYMSLMILFWPITILVMAFHWIPIYSKKIILRMIEKIYDDGDKNDSD